MINYEIEVGKSYDNKYDNPEPALTKTITIQDNDIQELFDWLDEEDQRDIKDEYNEWYEGLQDSDTKLAFISWLTSNHAPVWARQYIIDRNELNRKESVA